LADVGRCQRSAIVNGLLQAKPNKKSACDTGYYIASPKSSGYRGVHLFIDTIAM
jgi:ppGpp synthetase/RelA/SpoT-type nucleotidyltranferase